MGFPNIACPKCGVIGKISKYGTKKQPGGKIVQRYMCGSCFKVIYPSQLPELEKTSASASKGRETRQEKKLGSTGVKPDLNELWAVYEESGEDVMAQQLREIITVYEKSKQKAKPEAEPHRLQCLRCGHKWKQRVSDPKKCPACNSPYWRSPRKDKVESQ